jgi:hypothetical protein
MRSRMGLTGVFRPLAREDEMGRGSGRVDLLLEARSSGRGDGLSNLYLTYT